MVHGLIGLRASRPPLLLSSLASFDWTSSITLYECEDKDRCIVDLVVDSLRVSMERWPLAFDFVVIPEQLAGVERLSSIPFLVDTTNCLRKIGKFDDSGLRQLLSSTFVEAYELVGDVRVVLDLFVTGKSWLIHGRGGRLEVAPFVEATSLADESNLMALRYARTLGVSPNSKYYSSEKAIVYGRRFGVSLDGEATLGECADKLGLSRERFRQIIERLPVSFSRRQWPLSEWASQIQTSMLAALCTEQTHRKTGYGGTNLPSFEDAGNFLSMYGLPPESYKANNDLEGRLARYRLTLSKIKLECYRASESLGFVHESTALDRLRQVFVAVESDLFEEAIRVIHRFDLPAGYLYFESSTGSAFLGSASRVLAITGRIPIEELYQATARYALYRQPHNVFPPRTVVRELLVQDSRFVVHDDSVDMVSPAEARLDGLAGWMYLTICEAPGRVIYRSELLEKARHAGHNGSSVQVFMIRHELFKMCGSNCVTLVGVFPTDREIEFAYSRGLSVRVGTESSWKSKGDKFVLELIAGTDLCDGGLLILDKSLVGMFGGRRLKIMVARSHHGHVGWSKGSTTGWATAMRRAGIDPGDRAEITLDSASDTARVRKIS